MAKQLNVNLAFSADTSKVKAQLQELQSQLNKITMSNSKDLGIEGDIKKATRAAAELQVHLQKATNVDTGTLDFSKLNQSIKSSGTTLQQYGQTLASLGPQGQEAFMSLAQAVANSEVPIRRANKMLKEMGTTLANTARWQISSSILHGFMGAVQSAYGYAQDLNESLNNIRIVTGKSIDDMAKFAQEANSAAKALSATTTEYTNASLIYYQQGLDDNQIKERTDITIKMANVARQSAEVVADQMTAVWNNFYDGSQSLEYFADAMTALGAATASSTDEIAGGLEKFAAIGDTIGLSFEYAASALATITSNTRQSEEVVGTALKTIFARIQGLTLGETLEDGTDLNKYSEALQKVGISIFDSSGELKNMDNILDEMAATWDTLSSAQQNALAQTVAGVRQYTQLVSLMENWDNGDNDSMMANVNTAKMSEGTLNEQSEIYAEGWEAAQKRVQAALESIYDSLVKDEFFIDLLNNVEKIISFVDHLIDSLGGLKGALSAIGAIVTKLFANQISQGLTNMAYNVSMMTDKGREKVQNEKKQFIANASNTLANMEGGSSEVQQTASSVYTEQLTLQQKMVDNADKMTEMEQLTVQQLMDQLKLRGEIAIQSAKELDAAKQAKQAASEKLFTAAANKDIKAKKTFDSAAAAKELAYVRETSVAVEELDHTLSQAGKAGDQAATHIGKIPKIFSRLKKKFPDIVNKDQVETAQQLADKLKTLDSNSEEFKETAAQLKGLLGGINAGTIDAAAESLGAGVDDVRNYSDTVRDAAAAERTLGDANRDVVESGKGVSNAINDAKGKQQEWADIVVQGANFALSAATALSMLGNAFDTLKDPDVSGWEKFVTVLTTVGMVVPTLISLWKTFKTLLTQETVAKVINAAATLACAVAEKKLNKEKGESSDKTKKNIKDTWKDTKEKITRTKDNAKDKWNDASYKKSGDRFEKVRQIKGKDGKLTNVVKDKSTGKFMTEGAAKKVAGQGASKALGSAAGGMALIAAGVMVAVGAVKWGIAQYEKQAKAAEEAAKSAARAGEEYKKAAEAYNTFTSNMDNYKSGVEGLQELTKGTAEYREGILKANEAAMELINSTKGLEYSVNSDGLIEIDEASLERAQHEKMDTMLKSQNTKAIADQKAQAAKLEAEKTEFAREELKSSEGTAIGVGNALAATAVGAGSGALIGAGIGMLGGPIGAAIGAAIGTAIGGVVGIVGSATAGASSEEEQEAIDKLAEIYNEEGNAAFADDQSLREALEGAGITDPALIDSLVANREGTMELVAAVAANTAANEALNQQMAATALANNDAVQESDYKDDIVEIAGDQMEEEREKAKKKLEDDGWGTDGISKATGVNDEAERVFEEYAKAAGMNMDDLELVDTKGSDKNREFVYKDAEGNEQTVSLEDMKDAVAASQASDATNIKGTNLAAIFEDFSQDQVNAAKAAMTGDSSSLNVGQIQNGIDAASFNLTQEELTQMGYANLEEYQAALDAMVTEAQASMEGITLTGLDPDLVAGMTLETAQAVQKTMDEINLGPLGEEGGKAYAEGLNKMVEGLDTEEQQKALQQLNNIDWSSWDAMEQADQIMKEFGVDIDTTSQDWVQFADKMRIANNSLPDFSKMKEDLITVSSVVSKLDVGSIISDEDYNKLMAYNDEWDRFFVLQADGTRKFIGDKDAMLKATREDILAQKEELELSKKRIDAIKESGVDWKISAKSIDQQYGDGKDGQLSQDTVDAYNDEHNTEYTDSDDMINNLMADQTQEMIDSSAEMKAMLNESGYDDATIDAILQEARDGNRDRLDTMLGAVDDYMAQDLETANKELDEMLASTATSIEELNQMVAQGNITDPEAYTKQVSVLAQSATSLEELHRVNDLSGGTLSAYEYGEALTTLAANFENCAKETEEYEKALLSGDAATIQAAQSALEASIEAGELAAKYDLNAEELEDYGKRLQTLNKDQKLSASEANRLAAANMRLDRGVGNLNDNLKNYKKALKDSNKGSAEWSKALSDLKTDLSDIVNVADGDMLSDTFAEATLESEDLQKALDGDEAAILRLRLAAADDIIANLDIEGDENIKTVSENWEYLKANMAEGISTPGVDQTELINSFNEMIAAGNMTKEEIEAALSGLNVSANVKTEYVPQTVTVPQTITEEAMLPNGTATVQVPGENGEWTSQTVTLQKKITRTYESAPVEVQGVVPKYSIEGTTGEGGVTTGFVQAPAPKVSKSQTSSGKGGGGGGGGGSKKKTSESRKKKNDMVDRYKEINDQLEKTSRQMNKTSIAADGLWGAKRFNMLKKNIDLMKQEHKQLEKKYDLAKKYLKEDKNALVKAGTSKEAKKNLGMSVNFKFDESGAITNYTEQMTALYKKREALLNSFGSEMDEKETERLEKFDKSFDELKEAYEQYETTLDEKQDLEEEAAQKKLETQEAYLNLLNEELELKVAINDADLEVLDYYLSKIEGDLYAAAEGMKYMGEQAMLYEDNLVDQYDQYEKLNKALQDEEINMAQYKESMKELQAATISNLQSLQESKTAMQDYYGNVLSMAQEELASFTDQMSQLNSVMDHYTSLLDMLGKTKDFETRDKILTSKANNIRNELDVYTEEYRMYSEEAEEWEAKMLEAEVGSNEYETYKKNWDAAREAANEAQENMLAKTEEWAEAMRAIVENNLSGLAADLEASLTGGSNFDTILNSMDRANSLQEEYLTTTNKIYETNKLMRTAQQEIDKTSNEVAKRKMKDFIAETKQLQNQGQLSKYELEIQQAKYDLLLAEIALEEAQNAKSTVRLQRDSEGNFGYVYTADSSKTAEAEQKFADAQNKLYNIGLEGANNYNQKYAEAMSEMYNELTELQQKYLEGQFASEDEYQKAVEATKEYHYNKLKQFSSLYQTALTTDSRVIADAWSTDFNKMICKTDEWKDSIDNYTQQAASELAVWSSTVSTVMSESGLDKVNSELEKMAADSEALKEVLLGDDGLIAAVEEEVEQVGALSEAYIEVQNAIDDVIKSYEDFLGLVNTKFTGSNSIGATTITLPTVQGFDTGGYTGEWGSWGKLAMLHEKEMILNQQDTANLLKTMEFLDNIINAIDLQATNAALGGLLSSPTLGNMNNHETLEQSVKIEASFPNVSSRFEIEEAFETLINRASQYANRK